MESTIVRRESADEPGKLDRGTALTADELQKIPLFSQVSRKLLEDNHGAVVLRQYEAGDVICRQGDFGSTAFYVLSGSCDVFITTPISHVETEPKRGLMGLVSKMGSMLRPDAQKPRAGGRRTPTHVRIDAPVDLPWGEFCATIGSASLFGEMTCLNFYPRSATVIAKEPVTCLELLRNILDLVYRAEPQAKWRREKSSFLAKNPGQKFEQPRPADGPIGAAYRERALRNHLRDFGPFQQLSEEFLERLRQKADIVSFEPGEMICKQGELADEFYIIRIGFVKVSQHMPGGDMVLEYLSRGQHFGEIALLAKAEGKEARRVASCSALDHVEVVAIGGEDFEELIGQFAEVRRALAAEAANRLKKNADQLAVTRTVELGEFLDQGLIQAQSLLVLDLERCTRCDECVRACADSHDGVTRLIRDGLRFDKYLVATSCRSCLDPVCMIGCPVGSIRRNETREIVIEDWCIGCEICAANCPYGNINMHPFEVEADSKLFGGQTPLREVRAKLEPLPDSFGITTMPEGMGYDARHGYLMYRGIPNEKNRKALKEFCSDAAYQKAVNILLTQMETRVSLPILAADFKPNKRLANFISYDTESKSLVFRGVVDAEAKEEYLGFSADTAYKKAVEQAAKNSYGKKAVVYKATTCDLCESLKQEPNCVYACPHDAAKRVEPRSFFRPILGGTEK
jgi:CRP-like cAMP-binding protein/Pyruvate/2-oxoacid:ferredoxin oxidoreductase delta subunit